MNAMKLEILEILRTKGYRIKEHLRLTYGKDLVKYNSETPAVLKKIVVSTVYRYKTPSQRQGFSHWHRKNIVVEWKQQKTYR